MADWGIKLSQPGEDATGADARLVFSSSWKLLNIVHEESFSGLADNTTIYEHGYDYVPLFLPYTNQKFTGVAEAGVASFNHAFGSGRIFCDENRIFTDGSSTTGRVMVTPINLLEDYQAPSVNLDNISKNGRIDHDWGIKVALEGKDIHSTDTRDFAIHSGTRSPMVHMVKYAETTAGYKTYTYEHNLGYPPMFMVYLNIDGTPGWQVIGSAGDTAVVCTDTEIRVSHGYLGEMSVVVLKDPLELE